MSDEGHKAREHFDVSEAGQVDAFANHVLTLVADRSAVSKSEFRQDYLLRLVDAVQDFEPDARDALLSEMINHGIRKVDIVDLYIPAAAHILGEKWCSDNIGFADVTIGVARLQGMMRDLLPKPELRGDAPTIIMVSLADAYHTLGATLVANQLRRMGVSVRMAMGLPRDDVAEMISTHDFDAIMISASRCERLESIRELVQKIRTGPQNTLPIVVGGSIIEQETDIATLTGADFATSNPREALELCGIALPADGPISATGRL